MGSLLGMFTKSPADRAAKRARRAESARQDSRNKASAAEAAKKKGKVAARLALIKTGSGGLSDEATTGRKKLLGN